MQGWHYGKGLIYYSSIFRLTKLVFLRARAIRIVSIMLQESVTRGEIVKNYRGLGLSPAFKCKNDYALGFDIIYENSSQTANFFCFLASNKQFSINAFAFIFSRI